MSRAGWLAGTLTASKLRYSVVYLFRFHDFETHPLKRVFHFAKRCQGIGWRCPDSFFGSGTVTSSNSVFSRSATRSSAMPESLDSKAEERRSRSSLETFPVCLSSADKSLIPFNTPVSVPELSQGRSYGNRTPPVRSSGSESGRGLPASGI